MGREARSQRRVVRFGVWIQGPRLLLVWEREVGELVVRAAGRGVGFVGDRSGGGKEEGWLRVETMVGFRGWWWCFALGGEGMGW